MTTKGDSFIDAVDGKWMCGICLGVYRRPVSFPCGNGHSFCEECAHEWQQTSARDRWEREGEFGTTCPICRVRVAGRQSTTPDEALRRGLESTVVACGCGENVVLSLAREHFLECPITKDEAALEKRRERKPKRPYVQRLLDRAREAGVLDEAELDRRDAEQRQRFAQIYRQYDQLRLEYLAAPNANARDDENDDENEETLNNDVELVCPICNITERPGWEDAVDELGLDELPREAIDREVGNFLAALDETYHFHRRRDLIAHVLVDHEPEDTIQAVCPICASLPHGDPNYQVQDFYYHVVRRHGFDWTLYMPDLDRDEEEVLQEVLRASRDAT